MASSSHRGICINYVLSLTWESHTWKDGLYIEMGPWTRVIEALVFIMRDELALLFHDATFQSPLNDQC